MALSHVRLFKHYFHTQYLTLGVLEFLSLAVCAYQALQFSFSSWPVYAITPDGALSSAAVFAFVMMMCNIAMGAHDALLKEGLTASMMRTVVSFCLLGSVSLTFIYYVFPTVRLEPSKLLISVFLSLAVIFFLRWLFLAIVDSKQIRRRIVVLGAGKAAAQLLRDIPIHSKSIEVLRCIRAGEAHVEVDSAIDEPDDWLTFTRDNQVTEIVFALDDRRMSSERAATLYDSLLACKFEGVSITDALHFYERELSFMELNSLRPGWMVFSDGFIFSQSRDVAKRVFDIAVCLLLLAIVWPFMLLTALAVMLESGRPILYSQERVGLGNKPFRIYKFRSMVQDAEKTGAVWAKKNDARVTKVGKFIRNTRLDELPQIYNVLRGDMSFVGPRPERPEFVNELKKTIPFYAERHRVKPGLMGWAQLKYAYGASTDDAANKLRYDLYYMKNHTFLMDMMIVLQTVEIVLLGKGVH